MSSETSVTQWLDQLKAGDPAAAQRLWERYFHRLVGLARKKLRDFPRRSFDEEDVALSAFDSFFRRAEQGRFPALADRDSLWRVLVTLTDRKARRWKRDESRPKRGGGKVRGDSALIAVDDSDSQFDSLAGHVPTPAFAAALAEEFQQLLDKLGSDELQKVAIWKMDGYSNQEIAQKLQCQLRSVGRKLASIRKIWTEEIP